MYICEKCGAHLDAGEKCDCEREQAEDEDKPAGHEIFMIRAVRCRRCGGILTSEYGIKNGIGQCCYRREQEAAPDVNQQSFF